MHTHTYKGANGRRFRGNRDPGTHDTHTHTHTHTHNLIYTYILHTGRPLEEDSAALESHGVTDGATIHLVLRSF